MATNKQQVLPHGYVLHGDSYHYVIERALGQGTFGITYLACLKMSRALGAIDANIKVAVKEFFMRDINDRSDASVISGSKGGIYYDYRKKFIREALNLSKLHHPGIIKVIESFKANNTVYYVMEYIGGGSLDDYILREKRLGQDETIRIARQIGTSLSFMHTQGMLHLDLKPSNIMLKETGDIVLIDFGLSKQYDANGIPESSTTVGGGTPGYAPIERAHYHEGKGFPVTMDIYALGGTMYKMLTGRRPPEASEILNNGFPLEELQAHQVTDRLSACIKKAMEPRKSDRYQSVRELIGALANLNENTIIAMPKGRTGCQPTSFVKTVRQFAQSEPIAEIYGPPVPTSISKPKREPDTMYGPPFPTAQFTSKRETDTKPEPVKDLTFKSGCRKLLFGIISALVLFLVCLLVIPKSKPVSKPEDVDNSHGWVDLGLSIKWAICNVGASKIEDYGEYFAWGETITKSDYSWSTYKYCNDSDYNKLTKYCNDSDNSNNGFTFGKTTLDLSDDVARQKWGGSWRMPTEIEFNELLDKLQYNILMDNKLLNIGDSTL